MAASILFVVYTKVDLEMWLLRNKKILRTAGGLWYWIQLLCS
nr:hypothetical protein [uncultured Flavobacterium sp.]